MHSKLKTKGTIIITLVVILLLQGNAYAFTTDIEGDSHFIATRGALQNTSDKSYSFEITDSWMYLNNRESYTEFDVSIIKFGYTDEYIIVELNQDYQDEINEARIDEMYQKISDTSDTLYSSGEIPVVFIWHQNIEDRFASAKNMPGFITAIGTIPDITKQEEKREWYSQLHASAPNMKLQNYTKENGIPLSSFGYHMDGYLTVGLEREIDEATVDDMYELIETHYEQAGINDVPVVFMVEGKVIEDEGYEPNKIPGFTSIMLVTGLLLALRIRK